MRVATIALSIALISPNPLPSAPHSRRTPQQAAASSSATPTLRQSLTALVGTASITDVTLTGSVRRIAGSDDESGTATLKALATGSARADLSPSSGPSSEIQNLSATIPAGDWSGPDGIAHPIASHNLLASQTGSQVVVGVQRDPQAIDILTKVLTSAAFTSPALTIQDYSGKGTITYYWAGEEVLGSVQVYGRGTDQFRLDVMLPTGVRSWAVSKQAGSVRESTGEVHEIPFHNAMNFGSLTLTYPLISAVLNDTSATIQYVGTATKNGRNAYQVRLKPIPSDFEPSGVLHRLSTKDLFVDATNFRVLSTVDMIHPDRDFYQEIPHEVRFYDYRKVNGVVIPFAAQETVGGQHSWTIQLDTINLNPGLSDTDFQI